MYCNNPICIAYSPAATIRCLACIIAQSGLTTDEFVLNILNTGSGNDEELDNIMRTYDPYHQSDQEILNTSGCWCPEGHCTCDLDDFHRGEFS